MNDLGYVQKHENKIKRKHLIDRMTKTGLFIPALISASVVLLIVVFIAKRGLSPFLASDYGNLSVKLLTFLTGNVWFRAPNIYGIFFIVIDTIYIVVGAAALAIPVGVLTALFVVKIAPKPLGKIFSTSVELLAAVPSIVFGVFGLGVITKFVVALAAIFGLQTAGGISTLSTILVLAIMIFPTIAIMSITAIRAVDLNLEKNSLALGASKMQTYFKITLSAAKSGIMAGIILGIGRAFGEATAVSMVAGNAGSGPTFDLFSTTRTLTSTMLLGLKETAGLDYDIRFSVGLVLILLIVGFNLLLNYVKKKIGRFS
jgi:phosphate transport system permease protein